MNAKLNRFMGNESGISALEVAIILLAFVVVAAIFTFTVLSTGTFLTERSKEAAQTCLPQWNGDFKNLEVGVGNSRGTLNVAYSGESGETSSKEVYTPLKLKDLLGGSCK